MNDPLHRVEGDTMARMGGVKTGWFGTGEFTGNAKWLEQDMNFFFPQIGVLGPQAFDLVYDLDRPLSTAYLFGTLGLCGFNASSLPPPFW